MPGAASVGGSLPVAPGRSILDHVVLLVPESLQPFQAFGKGSLGQAVRRDLHARLAARDLIVQLDETELGDAVGIMNFAGVSVHPDCSPSRPFGLEETRRADAPAAP